MPPLPRSPLLWLERPGCAQLFFVYAGRAEAGAAGHVANGFLQTSGLVGRNLVLVRDPHDANYERGITGELPTRDALLAWHRTHLASLPSVRETYCIGNSSGGYGALYFGHELRVARVWSFSGRPAREDSADAAIAFLRNVLSTNNGVTEYLLFFAADNRPDRAFAESLADCPGVALVPRSEFGDTHQLMRALSWSGELARILPRHAAVSE